MERLERALELAPLDRCCRGSSLSAGLYVAAPRRLCLLPLTAGYVPAMRCAADSRRPSTGTDLVAAARPKGGMLL